MKKSRRRYVLFIHYSLFIITSFLLLSSCDHKAVFDKNVSIPDYRWEMNNILRMETDIKDTVHPHNIYINLRHASGYQFSNIFLFLTTRTPKGEVARDTVEIALADDRGKWLGDGMGDIWDYRALFKRNFRFPEVGTWHFELQQAMRINPLPQVMDAGIRIESTKNE
jgi:gliding motility-associated lipoprotein GldH